MKNTVAWFMVVIGVLALSSCGGETMSQVELDRQAMVEPPMPESERPPTPESVPGYQTADPYLRMARDAIGAGELRLAEYYLEDMLSKGLKKREDQDHATAMLAQVYWQQGEDRKLLDLVEKRLNKRNATLWWCRVVERRGNFAAAAKCWEEYGDQRRMERAIRERELVKALAPYDSGVGLRRDNARALVAPAGK